MISVSVGYVAVMVFLANHLAVLIGMIKTVPGPILLVVGIVLNSQEVKPMGEHHRWMITCQIKGT